MPIDVSQPYQPPGPRDLATKTPVDQSMIQRVLDGVTGAWNMLTTPVRNKFANTSPLNPAVPSTNTPINPGSQTVPFRDPDTTNGAGWFGPGSPPFPSAPSSVKGRATDFPIGYNLGLKPRQYEPLSFEQLRQLADGNDILRLCIETRKDQMAKLNWSILPRKKADQITRPKSIAKCEMLEDVFNRPDGRHDWDTWLRLLVEDLFVIDAPSLYVRKTNDGSVFGFEVVDGSTIKVVLDKDGRTPEPPYPAFQQVIKGLPAVEYTVDELIYRPRNPRPHKFYGYSPVEQVVMTVNVAIRRAIHQLQFYTEGNIPEALITVPPEWSVDQISAFQKYWDALLEGNTAIRRHAKFIPGGMSVTFTKGDAASGLKDDFDEWIARVICYAFSLPPMPFVRQMNRASAETAKQTALEEGLAPLMEWIKSMIDDILAKYFDAPDLEFVWDEIEEQDPHIMAAINAQYLQLGVKSVDEVRAELGMEPIGMKHAIWGVGQMGISFVADLIDPANHDAMVPQTPPPPGAGMGMGMDSGHGIIDVTPKSNIAPQKSLSPPGKSPKDVLGSVPHTTLSSAGLGHLSSTNPDQKPNPLDHPVVRAALGKAMWQAANTSKILAKRRRPTDTLDPRDYP